MPAWREKARALGLVRQQAALVPPRPKHPLTWERVEFPRVPPPELPANAIRSMKRAPALPTLPNDGAEGLSGTAPVRSPAPAELSPEPEPGALGAVARAVAHVAERRTAIPEAEIRAVALGHAPGRYALAEVDAAIDRLVRGGELIEVERRGMDRAFVTQWAVRAERRVLASMRAGRGNGIALADGETVEERIAGTGLTDGQMEAVRTVLLSDDLTVGVQGHAGSGKTTMLREVKALLGNTPIRGLAPSAAAARVLQREAGIPSTTLQYFLTRFGDLTDPQALARAREDYAGSVLAVDEASMIDTMRMAALLRIAASLGVARVALVGDTAQLRAVDAGQPFRLLQKAGMKTAAMTEILRQRDPELLEAVTQAREGEPGAAIEGLGERVREAPREALGFEAARRWLALPPEAREDTLLLAPTHAIRRQANEAVREGLELEGVLHGRVLTVDRLVDRRLTRAQAADIGNYEPGDLAVFHRDHYGCRQDDVCTVTGIEDGMVILAHPDGQERRFRPSGNAAWYLRICDTERIELRAGDRIRWTRNRKAPRSGAPDLVNGGEAEIVGIDSGRVRFRDADGRAFNLALADPQLRHLDHAYCSTVHSAQGRTARAAIAVLEAGGAADRELFHVELSRVSHDFLLLTDDREALIELLEAREGIEDGALEALGVDPAEIPAVDLEVFADLAEDWRALQRRAEETSALPFFLPGYHEVMARAAALSEIEDLPADMRRFVDGMLAEHETHLARDREVKSLTRKIRESWQRWPELGWAARAQGCAVEELPRHAAWREEGAALLEEGTALLEARSDLRAMPGALTGLESGIRALERTRFRDEAVVGFEARLREVNAAARAAGTIPFYAEGHGDLLERARAVAGLPYPPPRIAASAGEVIADAQTCERRRGEIEALHGETARLLGERRALEDRAAGGPLTGLDGYAAWSDRCEAAERSWKRMLGDPETWRPHLDRLTDEAAAIEADLDRLAGLRGRGLFDAAMERVGETAQAARARGILPFHDGAWRESVAEAERLARKQELDEEARRRLQAALDEQAAREAEWATIVLLLRDLERLARRECRLEIEAEREGVDRTELPGWRGFEEERRRIGEKARAALGDGMLRGHWESRPDIGARIGEGLPEAELAEARSVAADDFPVRCGRDVVPGDLLRWTEIVRAGPGESPDGERAGREEAVRFTGGLVSRTAEAAELEDRCVVEVHARSDDGPLGRRTRTLGTLVGGGCARAWWEDEETRRRKADGQKWELRESRAMLLRPGPHWSMTL